MTICPACGAETAYKTMCATCGASLGSRDDSNTEDIPTASTSDSKWQNRAGALNAGSLLAIPLAILADEFSSTVLLLAALANGGAGVAWFVSAINAPRPSGCWAVAGIATSGVLGYLFLTFAVGAAL